MLLDYFCGSGILWLLGLSLHVGEGLIHLLFGDRASEFIHSGGPYG
jgi:hypothetical protein